MDISEQEQQMLECIREGVDGFALRIQRVGGAWEIVMAARGPNDALRQSRGVLLAGGAHERL